jgi:cardiolipin synthase A/B
VAGSPLYTGNRVTVLRDGPDTFAATFAAIHSAQHYLYLEYYIFEDVSFNGEQLADLLIARQQQGVQIDVIYDGIGSLSTPGRCSTGCVAPEFASGNSTRSGTSPFSINDRDHRKILIADGQSAIIGGVNLSVDYESGSGGGSSPDAERAPATPAAARRA